MGANKYRNKKCEVDGMVFDSKKEMQRYLELKALEKARVISGLKCQVEFLLIPEQREPDTIGPRGGVHKGKLIERKVSYIADFVYVRDNKLIVEDVKGIRVKEYILKRKLMRYIHGIDITEV